MKKEDLQKSLQNLAGIITKGRILINNNSLTGEEMNQLFIDIKTLSAGIEEFGKLQSEAEQKVIASKTEPIAE